MIPSCEAVALIRRSARESSMRIWKLSHGDIRSLTVEGRREELLRRNVVAMVEPDGYGRNLTMQSDRFREISGDDLVILSHGSLVVRACAGLGPVHPLRLGDLRGWLAREYEPLAEARPPRRYTGRRERWLPNGNSTCWEVPKVDWLRLERLILLPHFNRDLDWLKRRVARLPPRGKASEPAQEGREGRRRLRQHWAIERDRGLVAMKKERARQDGRLCCEVCGFDFVAEYGPLGDNFIEVHHKIPLASLEQSRATKLSDLALLCANCHRMVHRRDPLLGIAELRSRRRGHRR